MKNTNKNAVIRARCADALKAAVEQIAQLHRLDESDVVRMAVESYVQQVQRAIRGPLAPFSQ
jgi:hypothetical protein